MSRVTALRTIRIAERSNLIWVEVETDEGLTGLGESFRGAQGVEAVLHEQVAPWLVGRDARQIEAVSRALMTPYLGFNSGRRRDQGRQRRRYRPMGPRRTAPRHPGLRGLGRRRAAEHPRLQHLRGLCLQHGRREAARHRGGRRAAGLL
ncbi:MAG: hypothetical protein WDN49_11485 [Acetobacteraceae bacterium]